MIVMNDISCIANLTMTLAKLYDDIPDGCNVAMKFHHEQQTIELTVSYGMYKKTLVYSIETLNTCAVDIVTIGMLEALKDLRSKWGC
jgi:hypothetical protein